MNGTRAAAAILGVMLIAGIALADSTFQSASITIDGRATVQGTGGAVFVLVGSEGLLWDATATSAVLERTYLEWVAVSNPADDANYLAQAVVPGTSGDPQRPTTEQQSFEAASLTGGAWVPGAAILVRAADPATVTAKADGISVIKPQQDPRFDQGPTNTAEAGDDQELVIREVIEGEYLNSTLPSGEVVITGDLVVTVYGLDYAIGGEEKRSGSFVKSDTGGVVQGSDERHTLTLTGATLRLQTVSPLYVVTDDSVVTYVGSAAASDEFGAALPLDADASTLTLAPAGAFLAIRAPSSSTASEGARLAQGSGIGAAGAAALVLLALLVGALLVWRRRERSDDLQVAILAMEERRWNDALPRLDRLATRRPEDVGVAVDRALCLEQLGRHKDAARAFEKALRASPHHAEAHYYYARTLARLEQREAGLVHLETALELDPRLVEMARREPALRGL